MNYYLKLNEDEVELLKEIMSKEKVKASDQFYYNQTNKKIFRIYDKLNEELIKSDLERKVDEAHSDNK